VANDSTAPYGDVRPVKDKKAKSRLSELGQNCTPQERAALEDFRARRRDQIAPRIKVREGDRTEVGVDHPERLLGFVLLSQAFGTADLDFTSGLIEQLVRASIKEGKYDENAVNFMASVIKSVKPRDELEAMLAAQMAAVHVAAMRLANCLANGETIQQQDSAERAFNKLTRTFAMQMEALKRYRTGGEQKVTVQHVSVSDGGQAIVGNVTQAPAKTAANGSASTPPALAQPSIEPMPVLSDPIRAPQRAERRKK